MVAPVNVKLEVPTIALPDWDKEAAQWMALNTQVRGNADFYPLTVKAAYVIGVVHTLCESVSVLLSHPRKREITYIPAYGVFASGVELLGRCVKGNDDTRGATADLTTGFKWLVNPEYHQVPDTHELITTSSRPHTIDMLAALRHFAAHGQATAQQTASGSFKFGDIDYEILEKVLPALAGGLGAYWNRLRQHEDLCNKLAQANVIALRSSPVLTSWRLFEKDKRTGRHLAVVEIFNKFDWHV